MIKAFLLILVGVLSLLIGGCADLDKVMGREAAGTPVRAPEPERKVHCDLIFPGGADRDKA